MNFRGEILGTVRVVALIAATVATAVSTTATAQLYVADEMKPKQELATKLNSLSQDLDMKEVSFKDSLGGGGGGKPVNSQDGNSFLSTTTYHSYVWDYCMKWVGGQTCQQWLAPYVSIHGAGSDKSPLEAAAYQVWQGAKYGIWDMATSDGGSVFTSDGTLDRKRMSVWKLKPEVVKKMEKVGYDTADRQIYKTYNKNEAKNPDVMPNIEALRVMAARWTKMFRNRIIANLGEIRANQPGIEFALSEDNPDCKDYLDELKRNPAQPNIEDRINPQNKLSLQYTRAMVPKLQDRFKLCQQMLAMNAYAVNPRVYGHDIKAGDPKEEWIDSALYRANLAAIDRAGVDPRSMIPIDARVKISDNDVKQRIAQYATGGRNMSVVSMFNADQLKLYNRSLASAAVGFKEVSARAPDFIQDKSGKVLGHKIAVGSINLVKLNDVTPAMRTDLKDTGLALAQAPNNTPGDKLETVPTQLFVRGAK